MKILGIDQSYNSSGIIVLEDDIILHSECFKSNKEFNRFGQAYEIATHIANVVDEFEPEIVAIEGLAFGIRGNILLDLSGLQYAIIIHMQEIKRKKVVVISPTSLKKFTTGSGKASKSEMIATLPKYALDHFLNLGFKKTTGLSDLCDSFSLCKYIQNNDKQNDII